MYVCAVTRFRFDVRMMWEGGDERKAVSVTLSKCGGHNCVCGFNFTYRGSSISVMQCVCVCMCALQNVRMCYVHLYV